MNTKAKLDLLKEELERIVRFFEYKHTKTKHRSYTLKISSVGFSALITVLLGISTNGLGDILKNIAIFLGAVVTIINAIDAFYNYEGLWIKSTVTLLKLKELKRKVDFYCAGIEASEITQDKLEGFMAQLHRILKDDLREWLKIREKINSMEDRKDETIVSFDIKPTPNRDKFRTNEEDKQS